MDVGKVTTWHTVDLVAFQAELAYLWAIIYALAAGDAGDVVLNALLGEDEPTINLLLRLENTHGLQIVLRMWRRS